MEIRGAVFSDQAGPPKLASARREQLGRPRGVGPAPVLLADASARLRAVRSSEPASSSRWCDEASLAFVRVGAAPGGAREPAESRARKVSAIDDLWAPKLS